MREIATQQRTEKVSPSGVPVVVNRDSTTTVLNFQYLTSCLSDWNQTSIHSVGTPALAKALLAGSLAIKLKRFTKSQCYTLPFEWLRFQN